MTVPPTIVIEPSQSMALRPASIGVLGVSMSRKNMMMKNAIPSNGTSKLMLAVVVVLQTSGCEALTIDVETPAPRNLLRLRILYVSIAFFTRLLCKDRSLGWMKLLTKTPPNTGPTALAIPQTMPIIPKYLPRSLQRAVSVYFRGQSREILVLTSC